MDFTTSSTLNFGQNIGIMEGDNRTEFSNAYIDTNLITKRVLSIQDDLLFSKIIGNISNIKSIDVSSPNNSPTFILPEIVVSEGLTCTVNFIGNDYPQLGLKITLNANSTMIIGKTEANISILTMGVNTSVSFGDKSGKQLTIHNI